MQIAYFAQGLEASLTVYEDPDEDWTTCIFSCLKFCIDIIIVVQSSSEIAANHPVHIR